MGKVKPLAVAAWFLLGSTGVSFGDVGSLVRELRHAERLIGAAIKTGDRDELDRQQVFLMKLIGRIREATDNRAPARLSCGMAAAALHNIALDSGRQTARALVALEDAEKEYVRRIAECEKAVRRR